MIDIKPLACNLSCKNCYETKVRKQHRNFDLDLVLNRLKTEMPNLKNPPTLHGGEPLLLGHYAVEKIFGLIYEKFGYTGIQTNATLIDRSWIEIFQRFKTNVGISLDGHLADMNEDRGLDKKTVDRILSMIAKMKMAGLNISIISVLWKCNAGPIMLDRFLDFLLLMSDEYYVFDIRTNPGVAYIQPESELSNDELAKALIEITDYCFHDGRRAYQPSRDVVEQLAGFGYASCVFGRCDPFHTPSEEPIMGDGEKGICMKAGASQFGIPNLQTQIISSARYEIFAQLPIDQGGCEGCRFLGIVCNGGCPGESVNNDFREKTRFCKAYFKLFEYIERNLGGILPNLNLPTQQHGKIDREQIWQNIAGDGSTWCKSKRKKLEIKPAQEPKGNCQKPGHGDRPHGDSNDPKWRAENPDWNRRS